MVGLSVCWSVCQSVRTKNVKNITKADLVRYYASASLENSNGRGSGGEGGEEKRGGGGDRWGGGDGNTEKVRFSHWKP